MPNGQPAPRLRYVAAIEDYSHITRLTPTPEDPLETALNLIKRLKVYADRSASPIAHELCVEATEFVAKHTRTKP